MAIRTRPAVTIIECQAFSVNSARLSIKIRNNHFSRICLIHIDLGRHQHSVFLFFRPSKWKEEKKKMRFAITFEIDIVEYVLLSPYVMCYMSSKGCTWILGASHLVPSSQTCFKREAAQRLVLEICGEGPAGLPRHQDPDSVTTPRKEKGTKSK